MSSNVWTHIALRLCACVCCKDLHPGLRMDVLGVGSSASLASVRIDIRHVHAVVCATSQVSTPLDVLISGFVFPHCGYALIALNTPSAGALAHRHPCFPSNVQYC